MDPSSLLSICPNKISPLLSSSIPLPPLCRVPQIQSPREALLPSPLEVETGAGVPSGMGSGAGWLPVALLLLAATVLSPRVAAAAAAAGGEAEHAVQQHSERISGAPNFSPLSSPNFAYPKLIPVMI